ncbi:uncharacterized protein FIBRA_09388 [Fibroporia radiculosa]|uniref:Uncharacterized protein n=1 Tax=Fibroporia radiculosa TaxID=599839 RepID=J7RVX0_9APHY|nr:uncharacterized protein FIBRA_09388 [Fibroporia radiculosa]CCM07065.1 predicted protein [Fibroporia radiculosa]
MVGTKGKRKNDQVEQVPEEAGSTTKKAKTSRPRKPSRVQFANDEDVVKYMHVEAQLNPSIINGFFTHLQGVLALQNERIQDDSTQNSEFPQGLQPAPPSVDQNTMCAVASMSLPTVPLNGGFDSTIMAHTISSELPVTPSLAAYPCGELVPDISDYCAGLSACLPATESVDEPSVVYSMASDEPPPTGSAIQAINPLSVYEPPAFCPTGRAMQGTSAITASTSFEAHTSISWQGTAAPVDYLNEPIWSVWS